MLIDFDDDNRGKRPQGLDFDGPLPEKVFVPDWIEFTPHGVSTNVVWPTEDGKFAADAIGPDGEWIRRRLW